jgi:hypothetical protein
VLRALFTSFAAVPAALTLALAACGGSEGASETQGGGETAAAVGADEAAVLVTRDCGEDVLVERTEVPAGQTAMQALDRVADVETASGGKFVTEIEGVTGDDKKKLAWLYYVNGEPAEKGATEIKLAPGDVEWWDLHNYERECPAVPAEAK